MIKIKRGLDLPIVGKPEQKIRASAATVRSVALIGPDYQEMRPGILVKEGDKVRLGQPLFEDRKHPGVIHTSPGAGTVSAINRGDKRAFLSLEIVLGPNAEENFKSYAGQDFLQISRQDVQDGLIQSGLWTAFRTRPFSKVPLPGTTPQAIFVPAMDTSPLAPDPQVVIARDPSAFLDGLKLLTRLTDGNVYVCQRPDAAIVPQGPERVRVESFAGPHPAGLVGTHIHFLEPVHANKLVWHASYQDVIAMGKLFATGRLHMERVISLAGPLVKHPSLIVTRVGASVADLVGHELHGPYNRVISGSVLAGRHAQGPLAYLGRFHNQVSVIEESHSREFLGWQRPGFGKFSIKNVYASALRKNKGFAFTSSTNGSKRAMVPMGFYEKVMPLDIVPTFFLRALLSDDIELAQSLGALELDEEDLALCTFVSPGKTDYAPLLRGMLNSIEREG